ncbi:MAG: DUF1957 domain-containing protein [Actinobacteria bacterium]|nr:DUF1957 domain-containing protein [Actinomycetota bacterium]
MKSAFCLILHAHQPYVRRHGAWPCGEDWFHQAAFEAYLPLAEAFGRLGERGLSGLATVSFTPVLAGQLADPYLNRELQLYLGRTMLRAQRQAANLRGPDREALIEVAADVHQQAARLAAGLGGPWSGGAHLPWRELAESGAVELWTSAPGHAFLPGLRDEELIARGFELAVAEHRRVFGAAPWGAWLPECGYRPGLEDAVAVAGLGAVVLDGAAFEGAGVPRRVPARAGGSEVVAFPRDRGLSDLIGGPGGYPGGPEYRDFHHHDLEAGFKSYAVTHPPGTPGTKRPYDRTAGLAAARADARRFAAEVERAAAAEPGVIVAAFDLELFGHWWHEGPAFLEELLCLLAESHIVRPATLSRTAGDATAAPGASFPSSTWGRGGDDSSWVNAATAPIWRRVHRAEARLGAALGAGGDARTRAQALREFFLLSASDWPYMVTLGRAADYARERVEAHDAALTALLDALERGAVPDELEALEERDNLLPGLDLPSRPVAAAGWMGT